MQPAIEVIYFDVDPQAVSEVIRSGVKFYTALDLAPALTTEERAIDVRRYLEANKATMAKFEAAGQGKIVSGEYERAQKTLATAYTANKQTGVKGALKRVR